MSTADAMQSEAVSWLEAVTGAPLDGGFPQGLKNGVVLCNLMNIIQPGAIPKFNAAPTMPFKKMENVTAAIKAMRAFGLRENELFSTVDVIEEKNLRAVVICLTALGRMVQKKLPTSPLPKLGVMETEANRRNFTAEQLRGKGEVSLLNLGSSDMGKRGLAEALEGKAALADIFAAAGPGAAAAAAGAGAGAGAAAPEPPAAAAADAPK
jgi:hypothetical protein